ncbi:discoidin domain-containing protein, partial [Mycobacterium tuberculosis]
GSEWVEAKLLRTADVREVHLTFNDDVNEDLINLHHHETPFPIIPELVKSYAVQAWVDGEWRTVAEESGNRVRKVVHTFDPPVRTNRIRLVVGETNGAERAELCELRIYE